MWCMSFRNRICLCCYSYFPLSNAFCVDSFDSRSLFPWCSLTAWTMPIFCFFRVGTKLVALFTREMYMLLLLLHPVTCIIWIGQFLSTWCYLMNALLWFSHCPTEQDIMYKLCTTFVTIMIDRCFILQMGQIQVDSVVAVTATRAVGAEMTANAP